MKPKYGNFPTRVPFESLYRIENCSWQSQKMSCAKVQFEYKSKSKNEVTGVFFLKRSVYFNSSPPFFPYVSIVYPVCFEKLFWVSNLLWIMHVSKHELHNVPLSQLVGDVSNIIESQVSLITFTHCVCVCVSVCTCRA